MAPLVSVVIPAYNYGQYLAEAIDSALAQTHEPIEVVVIDDGSTDDTAATARRYGGRIRYHFQANAGPSAARNTGARLARGDYIVCLDADDAIEPSYVAECVRAIEASPDASYIYTQMQVFGREERGTRFPEFNLTELKRGNFIRMSALVRRELLLAFPLRESLRQWEDWDFFLTLAENGHAGRLLDKQLLRYRTHPGRTSLIDQLIGDVVLQRRLMHEVIRRHPKLYSRRAKWTSGLKAWLHEHVPFLVPLVRRLKGGRP